ncbi:MAG: cyclic nucleotide-binding domain-containing protein [Chlamydiae bacterium]|nr:cyclic nucleotide-binding domain-containing protein [Chlamydiota bacterium]MBI3265727.1 cyclic nucleotide-binding domain-containing protein [Chlamydiota bacterium]
MDVFTYLKRSDLCKGFSDPEILELKGYVEMMKVSQGHVLFKKGDWSDALYIICKGGVEICMVEEGREEKITQLEENAVLGEVGLLTDQVRSTTARALRDSTLLKITRAVFERLLAEGRLVAFKLVYQIAKILSFRLRQMDQAMVKMMNHSHPPHEINQLRARLQEEWPF